MKLHKFLLTPPVFAISVALFCGALFAGGENTFEGTVDSDWFNGDNWSLGHVPQADEAVVITAGSTVKSTAPIVAGSLTINGGILQLGTPVTGTDQRDRPHVSATVAGNLALTGKSKFYVYAGEIQDLSVFENKTDSLAAIRTSVNTVTIGGNLSVDDTSVVYPEAAELTGVPVFFKVEGDVTVAEGASFDTRKRGWGWSSGDWATRPVTNNVRRMRAENANKELGWSVAYGAGSDRMTAANYGAAGATYVYGFTFAPFLPGSPGGNYYAKTKDQIHMGRGPGSIVILAHGNMTVNGKMLADASIPNDPGSVDSSGPSGGGIWLGAALFTFGENARLSAEGGHARTNGYFPAGRGGRIAIAEGCSDEEIESLMSGEFPDSLVESTTIDGVEASVLGGWNYAKTSRTSSGSLSTVRSKYVSATLTTGSDVENLVAAGITWGDSVILNGEQSFTAPEFAYLKTDAGVRYNCAGFVVSNATGEVSSGEGRTATWTSAGKDGPYSLTWKWDTREIRVALGVGEGGSVTWGENVYAEDTEIWVPSGEEQTFVAADGATAKFVAWTGALAPGGYSFEKTVTFSATASSDVDANYSSGSVTRVWVGPKSGGSWKDKANWSPTGVPTLYDNAYITNATISFTGPVAFNRLVVAGTSKLTFSANTIGGTEKLSFGEVYAGATKVLITEDFEISGSATVTAANDPKTGAAVRFEVGGNFFLGEKAKLTADETGFYWYKGSNTDPRKVGGEEGATKGTYITQAPGRGYDYNKGGGYGGAGGGTDSTYSKAYGYKYAPFLPGSPNGIYGGDANLKRAYHPGGTVWLQCTGNAVIDGAVTADSAQRQDVFGSASGGGIWLLAANVTFGASARLSAHGGDAASNIYGSGGGGGRISIGIGLSNVEIAALAEGQETVDGVKTFDSLPVVTTDVTQGFKNGVNWGGKPGTTTLTVGSAVSLLVVDGSPLQATGVTPHYGLYGRAIGTPMTLTAEAYGYDPADDSVRYAFGSFVVSNLTEQVDAGTDRSVTLTPDGEPLSLVWKWGAPQPTAVIRKPDHTMLAVNGVSYETDATVWVEPGVSYVVSITPEAGYEFLNWTGDVPFGFEAENPVKFIFAKTSVVTPVVRPAEAPTTRTWGGGTGSWTDPDAWTPQGNIPGLEDDVVIAGGTCNVPNYLAAKSLTVSGGTLNVGTDKANSVRLAVSGDVEISGGTVNFGIENFDAHFKADVGGDLALSGSAKLYVYGGVIEGEYTHATGTSWVSVGGALTMGGTSTLYPVSSDYTGGSVVFKAASVTVGATAGVNADAAGYRWLSGIEPPRAPGIGDTYTIGGGYGGKGNGCNGVYGNSYGNAWAPVEPGSPNGNQAEKIENCHKPGGLIRIHAQTMSIAGSLTANASDGSVYGGASGGGIWLTADEFDFAATAKISATGGNSGFADHAYWSQGGGGRIAIETGLTDGQFDQLLETGKIRRKAYGEEMFTNRFSGVTVDVGGGYEVYPATPVRGNKGTFVYMPEPPGLMLLVK